MNHINYLVNIMKDKVLLAAYEWYVDIILQMPNHLYVCFQSFHKFIKRHNNKEQKKRF